MESTFPSTVYQPNNRATSPPPLLIDEATDPFLIIRHLLDLAQRGEESLATLHGWEYVRPLGKGGMGAVGLLRHAASGEQLALKVMVPTLQGNPKAERRFKREVRISKALQHPNLVSLRNWGSWQGVYFCTSEYCESDGLNDVEQLMHKCGGTLSLSEAHPLILQTLEALNYAHKARVPAELDDGSFVEREGVVHRDVKPRNIFLCGSRSTRTAKLGDFGLAKAFALAGKTGLTSLGAIGGSLKFMPQQLMDNFLRAEPDVDVWSAAATLYYVLTGRPPRDFSEEPPQRWLWVVSTKRPVPIRQHAPSISVRLAEVIDYALDDQDQLNFRTAMDFKQALENAI